MAQTHGKNAHFTVNSVDLSAYLTEAGMSRSGDVAESSTMGDTAKEYLEGLEDATLNISGVWDNTASTGPDAVLSGLFGGGSVAFEYGPEGGTTGDVKHSGSCICTGYEVTAPIGDVVAFTASFQVTGGVTTGTFA